MILKEETLAQVPVSTIEVPVHTGTPTDIVKIIWICNTAVSDVTIELWLVPNGATSSNANKLLPSLSIPKNDFTQIHTYMPLDKIGASLRARCNTVGGATIHLFGASIT